MEQRPTLQECIDYFHSNIMMRPNAVRQMEQLSEWRAAAYHWRLLLREIDAQACEMIAESTERGDAYRADVKPLNDWVEETVEKGIMTKDEAIKVIYPEMNRIYNQHFPRM
jgi:uncharacterized protein YajQ (UPF0234 family)